MVCFWFEPEVAGWKVERTSWAMYAFFQQSFSTRDEGIRGSQNNGNG